MPSNRIAMKTGSDFCYAELFEIDEDGNVTDIGLIKQAFAAEVKWALEYYRAQRKRKRGTGGSDATD